MKLINDASVKVKFLGSIFFVIIAMIVVGILGVVSMGSINDSNTVIYENNYKSTLAMQTINNGLSDSRREVLFIIQEYYSDELNEHYDAINSIGKICDDAEDDYERLLDDAEDERLFAGFQADMKAYNDARAEIIKIVKAGKYDEARDYFDNTLNPIGIKAQDYIDQLIDYNTNSAQVNVDDADDTYQTSFAEVVIVIIVVTIISILIGLFMASAISTPLKVAVGAANTIAQGNLTVVLENKYLERKDEIGSLAQGIKGMQDGLIETVNGIKGSTNDLGSQVAATNKTLAELNDRISDTSAATEELSASMEETGASSEEMNATAVEIEHAVETVAEKAEDGAAKSGEIHNRASELGKSIKESIKKSNEIFSEIKVTLEQALEDSKAVDEINALADAILGITSQTTLLALNASIEAARAGEAGRGFAVVANEISALADNSKNTVTQIQAVTKVVMSAVNNLASSSNNLLNFVASDVMSDYKGMEETAQSYTDDATYVSDLTNDLSATAEELLASAQVLLRAIGEVSSAAQEGARTTTTVAEQTSDISMGASAIVDNMKQTQHTSEELAALVGKFKLV